MKTEDAINFYGGDRNQLARVLGIWVTSTYQWGEYPPIGRQYQLEILTDGALKAERGADDETR